MCININKIKVKKECQNRGVRERLVHIQWATEISNRLNEKCTLRKLYKRINVYIVYVALTKKATNGTYHQYNEGKRRKMFIRGLFSPFLSLSLSLSLSLLHSFASKVTAYIRSGITCITYTMYAK